MKRIALLFAMFALLSGCSSMSPEQCQTADWYRVGYQDGRSGNNPNILYEYIKDCREAGVTPNHVEWQDGFDKGTILYWFARQWLHGGCRRKNLLWRLL